MTGRCLTNTSKDRLPLFLCFALPFFIAWVSYAVLGLYPFGDKQLLAHDEWHQYYPFFVSFREKLLDGGSLQYSWDMGMGTGYASLFAYYLASPLYLLSVLVPASWLREYFAFLTVLKLSCAGLFFGMFLRTVFRKADFSLPFFALMYAFCAWAGGYAWNIIWLDVFALLPLLVAGMVSLLREGRFRLYVAALALSLWCNYYIAYFCCIFVLLCFIGYCILCWKGFKNFGLRFLRIGLCTLLGVGLAAALLIPTLLAMQTTYSAESKEFNLLAMNTVISGAYGRVGDGGIKELLKTETLPGLFKGIRIVLMNLLTGTQVNKFDDTFPNLFCSFSAVILALYGLFNKKIRTREKAFNLLLLSFFVLSFIFRCLDYVWHGFHFPNMLYFRFSFLFSFVLIAAAYRSYTQWDHANKWSLFAVVPLAAMLLVNYCFTAEEFSWLVFLASITVLVGMTALLLLYGKKKLRKQLAAIGLCGLVTCEMVLCWGLAVQKIGSTTRSIYPKEEAYVDVLLEYVEGKETDLFWRTEVTSTQTLNDGPLNDYHGVSIFTSSANVNFNRFSHSLGLSSWPGSNRYSYYEAMPFTNTLCGVKYLVDRDGKHYNTDYNRLVASSGDVKLLENEAYISLGFMAASPLSEFVSTGTTADPISDQNVMFRLSTGIDEPLYTLIEHQETEASEGCSMSASGTSFSYSTKEASEDGEFRILYTVPADGLYCATSSNATGATEVEVYCNGRLLVTRNIKARSLFSLGNLRGGDELELVYEIDKGKSSSLTLEVAVMDRDVFDAGMETLADEPWVLTEFSDTHIAGTVEVKKDGFFYTSIPYEPGWSAYVDGEKVTLAESYDPKSTDVRITDAVISFPLSAGTHAVELKYEAPGLKLGLIISGACLLIFGLLVLLLRKNPVLLPDKYSREEYAYVPVEEPEEEDLEEEDLEEEAPSSETEDIFMEEFDYDSLLEEFSEDIPEETAEESLLKPLDPPTKDFSEE